LHENWANLNGLKIRYLEYGKGNDRHILFIHGLGSSADRWLGIPGALSANFHTVSIDLPGFGESDKPATMDYTIENFRKTVVDFINELAINDTKTSIVGHSLGGYIAAEVAIENKNMVERLVLIDSSGMLKKPTPLLEEYLKVAINPTKDKVRKVFEQMIADPTRIPSKLVEGFISRINLPNAKYAFKSTLANSTNTQIGLGRLKLIDHIPTLILWGSEDRVIPPEHSRLFKENIANSHIEIIPDVGHAPFAEKPDQVCEILRNFLT
jgi:pimeloyl-ACP methyl ester carboxylesterase